MEDISGQIQNLKFRKEGVKKVFILLFEFYNYCGGFFGLFFFVVFAFSFFFFYKIFGIAQPF